jgi:hypothetical protein
VTHQLEELLQVEVSQWLEEELLLLFLHHQLEEEELLLRFLHHQLEELMWDNYH